MDYPKSVPNVGLVNGKFVDENTATGVIGSLIPSSWGNGVTDEILAVITAANITPDEANHGQLLAALKGLTPGRLINVQVITASGTYTPTPGTKLAKAKLAGGGAAGSGSALTNASQVSVGGGGSSGSVLEILINNPTPLTVTIGTGGVGIPGGTGGAGGATQLGAVALAPGGLSGSSVIVSSTNTYNGGSPGPAGALPTTTATLIAASKGEPGTLGVIMNGFAFPGSGGNGPFGGGGLGTGISGAGPGAGGAGAASAASSSAAPGGNGSPGIIIIEEYS